MEHVLAGMAYLNKIMPGWETKIDLEKLHMSSFDHCILGQLWTARLGYETAYPFRGMCHFLKLSHGDCVRLGFALENGDRAAYIELTRTWRQVLEDYV